MCGGEGNGNPLQYSCLENPWTEGPGGLQSLGSHRVGHGWSDVVACMHALEKEMATHSSVLAWRVPGAGEPGGLLSMGFHRVRPDWSDVAAAAAGVWIWAVQWSRVDSNRKARLMWPRASWALGEADCHFCCANFPNCNFFIHKYDQIIIESSPGKPLETLKPSWIIFPIERV